MAAEPRHTGGARRLDRPLDSHTGDSLAEPLLNAEAAARLLSVRPSWVYDAARENRIPHLRIGRHVRFLRGDLAEWVNTQRDRGTR